MVHIRGEHLERMRQERAARRRAPEGEPANIVSRFVLSGETPWDDLMSRPDIVNIQDNVSQVGQGLMADRVNERLGQADAGIVHLRRIWARELKNLAEGRPLKQWERTEKVQAMSGGLEAKTGEGITAEAIAGGSPRSSA